MKSRTTRGNSDTVGLFPFLAVLLSTMGALLVLLVVLAQKAKQEALERPIPQARATSQDLATADSVAQSEAIKQDKAQKLERQLEQLHRYQQQLATLRAEAKSRQREEQLRLSHLEEHARRLEHELAKLYLTSEQLQATKEKQIVDQEQAERELARLKDLVEETDTELEALREQSHGKRSYAIIPYRGPQGTVRRPIYVECSKEGVVIQPEGIRLTAKDFIAPFDPGNPLAKALRAARDLLNTRAAKAGESEPPDPYPLLVVRPDGIQQYAVARTAIESWDADFGYEFINEPWTLQYPETDPELAQAMRHAVMQGRERIAMLIQAAPRRYGRLGISTSLGRHGAGGHGRAGEYADGNSQGPGWGTNDTQAAASVVRTNQEASSGGLVNGLRERDAGMGAAHHTDSTGAKSDSLTALGSAGIGGPGTGSAGANTGTSAGTSAGTGNAQGSSTAQSNLATSNRMGNFSGDRSTDGTGSYDASSETAGGSASGSASSRGSMGSRGGSSSAQARGGIHASSGSSDRLASARGSNWAIQNPQRGAVPIRRPIRVVIRHDRVTILRSRHVDENSSHGGSVISLDQPTEQVLDEFAAALRAHMKDWGLAGNGLYWRPVLQLNIGPQGQQQANRLSRLLEDSGVEIDRPHTAQKDQEVPAHATR
jgi:hypothetical protein